MSNIKQKLTARCMEILEGPLTLDKAILISVITHAGQEDKGQNSYIRHPLRVMEQLDSEDEMIIGVGHDMVEDSDGFITFGDLPSLGYTQCQIKSLDALTKRENEPYEERMDRVEKSYVARKVKVEDIKDNLALWRLKRLDFTQTDVERMQKYVRALKRLGALDKKGLRT